MTAVGRDLTDAEHLSSVAANVASGGKADVEDGAIERQTRTRYGRSRLRRGLSKAYGRSPSRFVRPRGDSSLFGPDRIGHCECPKRIAPESTASGRRWAVKTWRATRRWSRSPSSGRARIYR